MKGKAKRILRALSVSALSTALCSCMADTRYIDFASIGNDGWAHTDTLTYAIAPLPGVGQSGISLLLHTEGYGYENIALDIIVSQDSTLLHHEQHSYRLSDSGPKKGVGRRCDYTLPVGNFTLCDTLPTTVILTHRLDPLILKGVREVGIRISEPLRRPDEPVWKVDWR